MTQTVEFFIEGFDRYIRKNKEFIRFLKEHDCFRLFFRNLFYTQSNLCEKNEEMNFSCWDIIDTPISYAFVWSETKEGLSFWSDLEKKWRKHRNSDIDEEAAKLNYIFVNNENIHNKTI